jgi:hypothetical protein
MNPFFTTEYTEDTEFLNIRKYSVSSVYSVVREFF